MPCLNSVDLIATAGRRTVRVFQAADGTSFRTKLADALSDGGWTVTVANIGSGANPGNGFKATSAMVPWCASGAAPEAYVGRCRVWFYPFQTVTAAFKIQTEFRVMNQAETIVQPSSSVLTVPTTNNTFGNYAKYSYMVIVTPYDFKLFMIGVKDRVTLGISNAKTAVFCGVPQIPSFLQARGGWCGTGVNEMFYLVDASAMRTNGTYNDNNFWYGAVATDSTTYANNNAAGAPPGGRFGWFMQFGIGSGASQTSGHWVYDGTGSTTNWDALMWPPIILWVRDPANITTTREKMGFMWDAVIANKGSAADARLTFDDKEFITFVHNWGGAGSPLRPAAQLYLRIT